MGDPKKLRKKYSAPAHPWSKVAIEEEGKLVQQYGLKKKKEIYIHSSFLKKYKDITKRLIADHSVQGKKEGEQMLGKLQRLGLLPAGAKLDEVLSLKLHHVLERRLQSIAHMKGLARTMNQSRQLIVHRHIRIGNKEITSPGYLVLTEEEKDIAFKSNSPWAEEGHPERLTTAPAKMPAKEETQEEQEIKAEEKPKTPKIKVPSTKNATRGKTS